MSKKQDKIAARKQEQFAFLRERRKMELGVYLYNFEMGKKMYEQNKDQEEVTQEVRDFIEARMKDQAEWIENFAKEWQIDLEDYRKDVDEEIQSQDL